MIAVETYFTIRLVIILVLFIALGISIVWLSIVVIIDKVKNKKRINKIDKKKENGRMDEEEEEWERFHLEGKD